MHHLSSILLAFFLAAFVVAEPGTSSWPTNLAVIGERANKKGYLRKAQSDGYCAEAWMLDYLPSKATHFKRFEVYSPEEPEDGLVCEYAISPENKAMVILDVDKSSEAEIDACYRHILVENMKHKLGAKTTRTIFAADIVNKDLRKAIENGLKAAGKDTEADNAVIFKPGGKGWKEFYLNNAIVTGILNTLCASGKKEMGNARLKHFVAISRKNSRKISKPDLHLVTVLV